jgi:GT2 family glycosyltransferase
MIGITTITYNQVGGLTRLIESCDTKEPVHLFVFNHSRNTRIRDEIEGLAKKLFKRSTTQITVYDYGKNRGVAKSWNDGIIAMMDEECFPMIIVNDDITFGKGDIDLMCAEAEAHKDAFALLTAGTHSTHGKLKDHGFACFVLQPIAVETIGFFDENFVVAYNEDVDYSRRAVLSGLESYRITGTNVYHIGSATIKADPNLKQQNHRTHRQNDLYWKRKWGCDKNDKVGGFAHPFKNPLFGLKITREERHDPYPGYGAAK